MITIFTLPKPFKGHINIIQRNAIKSWQKLGCEIILMGDDEGVKETAREFGLQHVGNIRKNQFGTPLLNSAFETAQKIAKNNILVYINADMILMSDFIPAIKKIDKSLFLMNGRRTDLDVEKEIDFNFLDWEEKLRNEVSKNGKLHGYSGIDYFIFPRNFPHQLPDFAVGRAGWDNWLIYHTLSLKIPVIDATEVILAVHQNHSFSHSCFGDEKKKRVGGPELKENFKLTGGFSNMLTIREANYILTARGLEINNTIFPKLALFEPWRLALGLKRKIQNLL